MKKKRIVSLLLVCVMMLSLLPANIVIAAEPSEIFASDSGDGSSVDKAYIIETAEQLRAFSKSVTDGAGNDYSGKYIKLGNDIDLGGDESNQWIPIGNSTVKFKGTFDGNNKKITGVYIEGNTNEQGFFGYTGENAIIKNLGVSGNISGGENVGGLVGQNDKGKITNCYYEGSVSGYSLVGGLVGRHGANGSEITSCYNCADVNGTGGKEVGGIAGFGAGKIQNCYNIGEINSGTDYVGGIAGSTSQLTEMDSCYNIGSVTGSGTYVGSIIGSFTQFGTVTKCYYLSGTANRGATGLTDQAGKIECIDNISKFNDQTSFSDWDFTDTWVIDTFAQRPVLKNNQEGSLTKSPYEINNLADLEKLSTLVNDGNAFQDMHFKLTADIDMSEKYGADKANDVSNGSWTPIGNSTVKFKGTFDGNNKKITGVYIEGNSDYQGLFGYTDNNATIKNLGVSGDVKASKRVGGLVGYNNGEIENCYYEGYVSGSGICVGGIAGQSGGTIKNSYNTAKVISSAYYVGGIVGCVDGNGVVENCYNAGYVEADRIVGGITGYSEGTIKHCYNIGTVKSLKITDYAKNLGGIVGKAQSGTVENCYNIGSLITGDNEMNKYVGGVTGEKGTNVTIKNCYYLSGVASGGIGTNSYPSDSDGETKSMTAAQMRDVETFAGWDFTNVWEMGGEYLNRPVLKNNKEIADGEEETPYMIYDLSDLEDLSLNIGDADYSGKHFKLMADIDMDTKYGAGKLNQGADLPWTPIGTYDTPFDGIFDGNGKTISNVYTNSENDYKGLFGYVDGGTVKNLTVSGTIKGKEYVGAVAGYLGEGLIENCHNTAATTVNGQKMYVGGIVGLINTEQGTVRNCGNSASVSNNSETHIGGITGQNFGTTEMCINKGRVSVSEGKGGGIVGVNSGTLRNCYNEGTVNGREHIGGIVGYNAVKTENCYSVGDGQVNDYNSSHGSIAGTNGNRNSVPGVITNCYYLQTKTGGIGKAEVSGSAESRTEEEFKSGSVAWALQNKQEDKTAQVWGQNIGSDNYPDLTSDNTKNVCKVAFMEKNGEGNFIESTAKYLNKGKTIGEDNMPQNPDSEEYTFIRWSQTQDTAGATFDGDTTVNGDMTIYAVGSGIVVEPESAPSKTIKLHKNALMTQSINLKDYAEYAAGDSKDDISFSLADGSTLPTGLSLSGNAISGIPTCDVGKYTVKFTVTNSNISLYSLREPIDETLELTFDIGLEGDGTVLNPYKINNLKELEYFRDDVNGGESYSTKTVKIADSVTYIDMSTKYSESEASWTPIGNSNAKFKGTFDGNGKSIANLYNSTSDRLSCQGLFGSIENATIKNLTVSGEVTGDKLFDSAGIVGYADKSIIENCCNRVKVTSNYSGSFNKIGGIAGSIYDSRISVCFNDGKISGADSKIGGVAGEVDNTSTVENCYNKGTVSTTRSTYAGGSAMIGGIVGTLSADSVLKNSCNKGVVTTTNQLTDVGGAVGLNQGENNVENVYYLDTCAGTNTTFDEDTAGESKTEAQFESGEVTWLLQDAQPKDATTGDAPMVWGQILLVGVYSVPTGEPRLIYEDLLDKEEYRVRKVTFVKKNTDPNVTELYVEHDAKYTNSGYKLPSMPNNPTSEVYTFKSWVYNYENPQKTFNENTKVDSDIVVYALGSEISTGSDNPPSDVIEIKKNTYLVGTDAQIVLARYVANKSGAEATIDNVEFRVDSDSALPPGMQLSTPPVLITGKPTKVGTYTVVLDVINNGVAPMSLNPAGTQLTLTINIGLEGSGTADDPYLIGDADELAYFRDNVNSGGDYGKSGVYVKLTGNIDLSSVCGGNTDWEPIGCEEKFKYCGVFDGNNKEISNLYINAVSDYQGLFGYNDGTIKNLTVSGQVISSRDYVGGIVGLNLREIKDCYNKANVTGGRFVGGIAGNCDSNTVNVSNCHNSGVIHGTQYPVGGITGLLATNCKIANCYNTGEVKGDVRYIGGIVGENYGIVQNCYNIGKVALSEGSSSGSSIGGIAGVCEKSRDGIPSSVTNCYYLVGKADVGVGSGLGTESAESRTEEQFNNGSVAWTLQNAQVEDSETQTIPQVWGQNIIDTAVGAQGDDDAYPILTSDGAKKVYRVRFYNNEQGGSGENDLHSQKYVNTGGSVTIPDFTHLDAYKGWAETPTGYTSYLTNDFSFNYGRDIELYAVWKGVLTFNPPDERQTYTAGTSKKITPTPLSDGQAVTGISAADFSVKYYEVEENVGAIGKLKSTEPVQNTISVGKYLYVIDIANAEIKNEYYIKSKFEVTNSTGLVLDENLLTTYDNVGFMYITSGTEAAQKPIYFTKQVVNIKKTEAVSNELVNANHSTVTYESTDTSVATVDANTGAVTVNDAGSTVIIATSHVDNTSDVYASYTLNVTKEVVTVTPKSKTITYGEDFADDGYEVSKAGVTLSGTPRYTTDYRTGDGIGKYEINVSGLTSDDYEIEYKSGKLTVGAKPITLDKINVEVANGGKTYDGSENAVLSANITESELISGDRVTVLVSGTYDSANAGDRTVSYEVTGLSGKDSGNYTLSGDMTATKSAVIQQAVVNVSMPTSVTYVYDTYAKSITAMAYANGIYFDKFNLVYRLSGAETDLAGLPTDKGTYTVRVNITDSNYKLPEVQPTALLKITPAQQDFLSIEGIPDTVTYGDDDLTLQTAGGLDGGTISYEITEGSSLVKQTDNKLKLVGVGKVTVKATSSDQKGNYEQKSATRTFVIRPKTLYVTATATDREYNGDKNVAVSFNNVASQLVGSDSVDINYTSATVATADVENNKTVFVNGLTVDDSRYQLAATSVQTTVNITKATITAVEMTASNKTYDGTDSADYTITNLAGVIDGDKNYVTVTGTAKFNSANVSEANKVTLSELALSGTKSGNYKLSDSIDKAEASASILKATVNFVLGTCSYVYDGKPHTADVTATVDGKPFTYYTVTYNGEASATAKGDYPIAIAIDAYISDNYISDYDNANPQTFTIVQADQSEMTITGLLGTIDYDKEFPLSVVGGSNGDTMTTTWSSSDESIAEVNSATGVVKIKGVGAEVTITATKTDSAGNHKPQRATVKFTPVKKEVNFRVTGLDFTYDNSTKSATVTPSYNKMTTDDYTVTYINENGDELTQAPKNAGKYYVEVKATGGYEGEQSAVLTIKKAKRDMTGIDITIPEGEIVYGSPYTIGSTYNGTDDKITYAGTGIYGTQDAQPTNAGNYTAILTIESDNFETATVTKAFKIAKAPLGVWAQSTSRPYGTANQPFTVVYRLTDLKNGDSIDDVVLNAPIATCTADASAEVGTYDITVSGGTADNYEFVPVIDAEDKDKNILTIESATGGQLLIIGSTGTASVGQTFALSAFYGTMNINGNVSWSSDNEAVATVDSMGIVTTHMAGNAKITAKADDNYGNVTKDLDLTVEKTEVSLSPVNTVKTYNGEVQSISLVSSNKNFTPITDGIGQNVTVTYTLATDSSVTEPKNVGTYAVSYVINDDNFSGVGNTLMYINKANVELKPKDITKTYGSAPTFKLEETSGSLLSEDKLTELAALVTFTSDGAVNTAAVKDGGYEITAAMEPISDENMNITLKGTGILTVEKAPLTVKVKDVKREYGAENPKLETEISGFVNGETKSVLKGEEQLAYADTINADTPVGTYTDSTSVSGLTADNYAIEFKGGSVEVTTVDVTASVKNARNGYINIRFDKPLAGLTIDNFEVKQGETPITLTSVVPSADNKVYTLNGKFTVGTKYTVTPKITSDTHRIISEPLTVTPAKGESGGNGIGGGSSSSGGGIGGGITTTYTVKFDTNGGNAIDSVKVEKNGKVTEPTEPTKTGYTFVGWFTDKNLENAYDFDTKVTQSITLYAKWTEGEKQPDIGAWKNPFADVKDTDWFFNSVRYANENKLMGGTSENTFAPNEAVTRGMLVTVLYRAEGEPAVNKSIPFADVKSDMYYANAVNWAQQNGIVKGVSETEFAPEDNITREQIAAIIYRYAEFKNTAPTGAWAIRLDYADLNEISDYAAEGVMYCALQGIMQGKENNCFAPKDNATRAEIAAILQRFIEGNK